MGMGRTSGRLIQPEVLSPFRNGKGTFSRKVLATIKVADVATNTKEIA